MGLVCNCLFCHYRKTSDEDYEPKTPAQVSKRPHTAAGQEDSSSSSSSSSSASNPEGFGQQEKAKRKRKGQQQNQTWSVNKPIWNDVDIPDITPPQPTFRPTNPPGPQLIRTAIYTDLQLFQLFWTNSVLQTVLRNTNEFGSTHHSKYCYGDVSTGLHIF